MHIYLIRHAEAVARGEPGIESDEARPLTDMGRSQARSLGLAFQRHRYVIHSLVTSPLLRAVQTAEELANVWGISHDSIRQCDHLAPGGRPRKLAKFIEELGTESVALVGHQPDIDELTGWLIGNRNAQIDMAKSGAALVEVTGQPGKGEGVLQWLVTPEWVS
jgi:phosphohistidine phosphatase